MTLDSKLSKSVYQGNGSTTVFPFAFKVWDSSQISVTVTDAAGVSTDVTSNSTVALTSSGGSVTYPKVGSPLPTGAKLAITRNMPFTQGINLVSASRFDPQVLEDGLDQATAERQQLRDMLSRTVMLPATSGPVPEDLLQQIFEAVQLVGDVDAALYPVRESTSILYAFLYAAGYTLLPEPPGPIDCGGANSDQARLIQCGEAAAGSRIVITCGEPTSNETENGLVVGGGGAKITTLLLPSGPILDVGGDSDPGNEYDDPVVPPDADSLPEPPGPIDCGTAIEDHIACIVCAADGDPTIDCGTAGDSGSGSNGSGNETETRVTLDGGTASASSQTGAITIFCGYANITDTVELYSAAGAAE